MNEKYMKVAILEADKCKASKDVPIGAVIVKNNKIIAKGYNKRNAKNNTLMHAEMVAINKACRKLKDWRLEECTMYVTLEPCPMCAGAIVQARIKTLVYGASSDKAGACGSILNVLKNSELNHEVEVISGVCKDECSAKIKKFFAQLRNKEKTREKNIFNLKKIFTRKKNNNA